MKDSNLKERTDLLSTRARLEFIAIPRFGEAVQELVANRVMLEGLRAELGSYQNNLRCMGERDLRAGRLLPIAFWPNLLSPARKH